MMKVMISSIGIGLLLSLTIHNVCGSLYDPHVFPDTGPFFEGWYLRINDYDNEGSVGLLFGHVLPETSKNTTRSLVIASLLVRQCENASCKLLSYDGTYAISQLRVTVDGKPVTNDPDYESPSRFRWEVNSPSGGGYFDQTCDKTLFSFRIEDLVFRGEIGRPEPWSMSGKGPEGWLSALPLPLHWFVYSLRSELVSYMLVNVTSGTVIRGVNGSVHMEKNWGQSFPAQWIWSEGVQPENNASFALSGGLVALPIFSVNAYLIGYRNPKKNISLDFRPDDSIVNTDINGCNGTVIVTTKGVLHEVEFSLEASPNTFSDCLLGPESMGFRPACVESYDARATVRVFVRNYIPWQYTLIDQQTFHGIALEFGGLHVCNNKCNVKV
ncbi:uncharacterized protein LOC127834112 [Dreissena polymorpha]|uniref:Uncharacterized protein n=1 Tax=Dreissena polymorpha TaxID=45954 RepID=A0A9D4MTB2_DREPO|nr:uncharacterized protein LOC127834105 [Dreissena polymorpha]XP_052215688.1 uncharacterized protein LOC127834112 [Dreissena polymorpha]KAH3883255.1 hypothetical protein DPMN_007209 [Dreissena polymorpha]KAH3883263.1 hypothetical protein DPMN_007217 [Dreissena polymorpha]